MKDIPGYNGLYSINESGKIFSIKSNIIMKTHPDTKRDYQKVTLTKDGIRKTLMIHRLVAITFIVNSENKATVNHKDGNNQNNHVSNLEWMTNAENIRHSFTGGFRKKENMGNKLGKTYAISKELLEKCIQEVSNGLSIRKTAKKFGVNRGTLTYQIKNKG